MADLPSGAAALLAVAHPRLTGTARDTLCAELASDLDWTWLVEQALSHGLGALLCRHLTEMPGDLLPDDIALAATAYSRDQASFTAVAVAELAELVDALAASGIQVLPFKGPVFGAQAYGDPSLRVFGDLDLLIAAKDVIAALAGSRDSATAATSPICRHAACATTIATTGRTPCSRLAGCRWNHTGHSRRAP